MHVLCSHRNAQAADVTITSTNEQVCVMVRIISEKTAAHSVILLLLSFWITRQKCELGLTCQANACQACAGAQF